MNEANLLGRLHQVLLGPGISERSELVIYSTNCIKYGSDDI